MSLCAGLKTLGIHKECWHVDFEIQHRAGNKHQNADALSRHPKLKCPNTECIDCYVTENTNPTPATRVKICPLGINFIHSGSGSSVCSSSSTDSTSLNEPKWLQVWSKTELVNFQNSDRSIGPVRQTKIDYQEKPSRAEIRELSEEGHTLWTQWDSLEIHNDLLYRRTDNKLRLHI